MHIDEFRSFQREGATHNVFSLVMTCRRKFLNAARLLELRGDAIDKLASFGVDAPVDVWPLLGPERADRAVRDAIVLAAGEPLSGAERKAGREMGQVLSSRPRPPSSSRATRLFETSCARCGRYPAGSPSRLLSH